MIPFIKFYEEKNAVIKTIHGRMQEIIDRLDKKGWVSSSLDQDLLKLELQALGKIIETEIPD